MGAICLAAHGIVLLFIRTECRCYINMWLLCLSICKLLVFLMFTLLLVGIIVLPATRLLFVVLIHYYSLSNMAILHCKINVSLVSESDLNIAFFLLKILTEVLAPFHIAWFYLVS